ncbi:MAG: pyridoxamine 5'-phosphate oxidase family protein [Actinomycetota bacterium]|nr:pyridoxamine 5'-phosphate oxidase family protein [Actinomycetota bacterium]
MADVHAEISPDLTEWIAAQPMFFVATAPNAGGHVNVSPKGLDTLRVLGPRRVAYLDLTGSGVETIAHVRENGRIDVTRVTTSCGYAVPVMDLVDDRDRLLRWAEAKGDEGLVGYRAKKNASSIDGLAGFPA